MASGDDRPSPYHRAMSRRLVSPTLVGRATELDSRGSGARRRCRGHARSTSSIAGEAGVGKSRLVCARRRRSPRPAGCVSSRAAAPTSATAASRTVRSSRRCARSSAASTPTSSTRSSGRPRADLARLVPALGPAAGADASTQTESLQAAPARRRSWACSSGSPRSRPVAVRRRGPPLGRPGDARVDRVPRSASSATDRVLLLMTFRADELHRRHPLAAVARRARAERPRRADRSRSASTRPRRDELLAAILGEPPSRRARGADPPALGRQPVLRRGAARRRRGRRGGRLPPTLREVLLARIVALPECAQAVIGVAAVAGRRVDHDLLARVAGDGRRRRCSTALRTAVGSQVLVTGLGGRRPEGDYAFRHALLQEAAYDDLLPGERQRLHRAFAEALAERGDRERRASPPATGRELAYHWSAARDDRRAFEASVRAARRRGPRVRLRRRTTARRAGARAVADGRRRRGAWPGSTASSSSTGPPRPPGSPAIAPPGRRAPARGASPRSGPTPTRSALGRSLERLGRRALEQRRDGGRARGARAGDGDHAGRPADARAGARPLRLRPDPDAARPLDASRLELCERAVAIARAGRRAPGRGPRPEHARARSRGRRALRGGLRRARGGARHRPRGRATPDDIGRGYVNLRECRSGTAATCAARLAAVAARASSRRTRSGSPDVRRVHPVRTASCTLRAGRLGRGEPASAEESVAPARPGRPPALRPGALGAAARGAGRPRARSRCSRSCARCSRGSPSRRSSTTPFRAGRAPRPPCGGGPGGGVRRDATRARARLAGSRMAARTRSGCSGSGCGPRRSGPRSPGRGATPPAKRRRSRPARRSGRRSQPVIGSALRRRGGPALDEAEAELAPRRRDGAPARRAVRRRAWAEAARALASRAERLPRRVLRLAPRRGAARRRRPRAAAATALVEAHGSRRGSGRGRCAGRSRRLAARGRASTCGGQAGAAAATADRDGPARSRSA